MTAYRMRHDAKLEGKAKTGTIVYRLLKHDYGCASDDSGATGIPHIAVTLDSQGGYPFFTVPERDLEPIRDEKSEPPDDKYVNEVCKIGQGAKCCRYLVMSGGDGWSCEKLTPLREVLDKKVATKKGTARGDNCPGRGSR